MKLNLIICLFIIISFLFILFKTGKETFRLKELKFIHITKTAGTSIEKIGKEHGLQWGMFDKNQKYYKSIKSPFWHRPFQDMNDDYKYKYDWFVVVRNPYDRILSEYYCNWRGFSREDLSKEQINQKLIDKINNIYSEDGHYIQQYRYIDDKVTIHILKFENLEYDFNLLMKKYNLNITLNKKTNKGKYELSKKFTVSDFSPELINLINEVYDKDFELFGYKKIYL